MAQDFAEAFKWYSLSAEHKSSKAQYNLGAMYGNGQGRSKELVQAMMWFELSAMSDDPVVSGAAKSARDFTASQLSESQIEEAERLRMLWQSQHAELD